MKKAVYDSSAPNGIALKEAQPAPLAADSKHVIVQVSAAAINPVDYKLGSMPIARTFLQGKGVGLDLAGTVVAAAEGSRFAVGTKVYGFASGTLAEKVLAPIAELAVKPPSLTFAEAAALPTVALTALQGWQRNNLKAGESALVIGASGGVGSMAVAIASKAIGARVTGVCSASNAAFVTSLGAEKVVDYNDASQLNALGATPESQFDVVYDTVSSPDDPDYEALLRSKCLRPGTGRWVAINSASKIDFLRMGCTALTGLNFMRSSYDLFFTKHEAQDLEAITQMVEAGHVKPAVQHLLPFTAAGLTEGFDALKSRRVKGKVVFDISDAHAK
jgi:NADPH:quinone reductase-like Zn-dependent oxidoreductase